MGFLNLIPVKDWIYAGIIAALLIGFGLFVHHERSVGAASVVTADKKAVDAQLERDTAVQSVASVATQLAEKAYENAIVVPVVGVAPIRCVRNAALGRSSVPAASGRASSGNSPALGGGADPSSPAALPDLAAQLVTIGRNADAMIAALQAANSALRAEMLSASAK